MPNYCEIILSNLVVGLSLIVDLYSYSYQCRSRDSSVVQHWVTGWMIGGSSPDSEWEFISSPPRPTSYPVATVGSFPGGKVTVT
jgi:hypothetical protein